ncbi:RND family transporter [Elusimicrobiota bacterium]
MNNFIEFIISHPKKIITAVMILTFVFGISILKLKIDNNIMNLIPASSSVKKDYDYVEEQFGTADKIVLGIIAKDTIFKKSTLKKIFELTDLIKNIDGVDADEVDSLVTFEQFSMTDEGIIQEPFMSSPPSALEEIAHLKKRALTDNTLAGYLITESGNASLIIFETDTSVERRAQIYKELKQIVKRYEGPERICLAGHPVIDEEMNHYMVKDIVILFPVALLVISILLYVVFRNKKGVFLPVSTAVMSIVWAVGLMSMMGNELTVLCSTLPIMLFAIGCTDEIHIIERYEKIRDKIKDKKNAVLKTMTELYMPVIMTSLTTIVGFLSLTVSQLEPIRQFGLFAAFGVFAALIFSLTYTPACIMLMKDESIKNKINLYYFENKLILWCKKLFIRSRLIVICSAALVIVSIIGLTNVYFDTSIVDYFKKNNRVRQDNYEINNYFSGTNILNVVIETEEADAFKNPGFLKKLEEFQKYMYSEKLSEYSLSIADLLKRVNRIMHNDDPSFEILPESRDLIAQYLLLCDGDVLSKLLDFDNSKANITIFTNTWSSNLLSQMLKKSRKKADEIFKDQVFIRKRFAGVVSIIVFGDKLLGSSQLWSLVTSVGIIFLMMLLLFRSVIKGLLCFVPLILTLLLYFALLGYLNIALNVGLVLLASVTLGIGIDYSIHFLTSFNRAKISGNSDLDSVLISIKKSGSAILINTAVLIVGFAFMAFAHFIPIIDLGRILALNMATSALGAIVVLPALLSIISKKIRWTDK